MFTKRVLGSLGAVIFTLLFVAGSFAAAPAEAQTANEVSGVFRLTLRGQPVEGYSFYTESSSGGAVICSTDPSVVASGVKQCVSGVQEVPFTAQEGEQISYRILGNPGNELGQFTVASGTVAASDGMTIDGSYNFPADQKTPAAGQYQNGQQSPTKSSSGGASGAQGAAPATPAGDGSTIGATTPDPATAGATTLDTTGVSGSQADTTTDTTGATTGGFETTGAQTIGAQASGATTTPQTAASGAEQTPPQGPVGNLLSFGGLLPESGGTSILLGAGVLLLGIGGFLFRRAIL